MHIGSNMLLELWISNWIEQNLAFVYSCSCSLDSEVYESHQNSTLQSSGTPIGTFENYVWDILESS